MEVNTFHFSKDYTLITTSYQYTTNESKNAEILKKSNAQRLSTLTRKMSTNCYNYRFETKRSQKQESNQQKVRNAPSTEGRTEE